MRIPEVLVGSLITIAILAVGIGIGHVPIAPQHSDGAIETYTLWLTLFTAVLGVATIGLWVTAARDSARQSRETEITQRAYLSVEPAGINPFKKTPPSVIGHIIVRNVGHLPARKVSIFVQLSLSEDRHFVPPVVERSQAEGSRAIHSTAQVRQGSETTEPISNLKARPRVRRYLYVWGAVFYHDGFTDGGTTTFCHRYNTASRSTSGATVSIAPEKARYHEDGNDAT